MPDKNIEIYREVLETFNRKGVEGILSYFSEEVEVYDPDLPPGKYIGPEAVRRVAEQLMSGFEKVQIKSFELVPAGDRVVALLHTSGRGERDEIEMEMRDAHTVTIRDGKIVYWRLYLDQQEALADAGMIEE